MKHFVILMCLFLTACGQNDSEVVDSEKSSGEQFRPAPEVSVLQAIRCELIAKYSERWPQFRVPVTANDALTILVRSQNSLLASAERLGMTSKEVSNERFMTSLGLYRAPMMIGQLTESQKLNIKQNEEKAAARVAPMLAKEFNDICAPLFL